MKHLIKKVLKEQISDKVIAKVLSRLERGKIKPPYFNNLDMIGLSPDEIKVVLEQFTNGKVDINLTTITDLRGNQIYKEDSKGYWYKSKYDKDGNEIYYETSDGYWWKSEYDRRRNIIYSEDSYGSITDKRNPQ